MHQTSINHMREFFNWYVKPGSSVIDIGSRKIGIQETGYKTIAMDFNCPYIGLDIKKGHNVDIVSDNPYHLPIENNAYDVCISGSVFEHSEFFWTLFEEMVRITKPKGLICVIAPSVGPLHDFPVDCWRFQRGGMKALAKWGDVKLLDTIIDVNTKWNDCVGMFRKG